MIQYKSDQQGEVLTGAILVEINIKSVVILNRW